MVSSPDVPAILIAWSDGDEQALNRLTPLVYDELHRLAKHYMAGERANHTLQTTALINEAYLRLVRIREVRWQSRSHFVGISARLMRQILVDFARTHRGSRYAPAQYPWNGGWLLQRAPSQHPAPPAPLQWYLAVRTGAGSCHALDSGQCSKQRIQALRINPGVDIIVYAHGGRAGTVTQAIHRLQADRAIGSGVTVIYAQCIFCMGFQRAGTHGLAGFGPTNLQHMPTGRLAAKIMVEANDAVHFCPGQVQGSGNLCNRFSGNIANSRLDSMQKRQQATGHIPVLH